MMNRTKRSQGFSLIELLIVVTIILILAAIAIPKLLTVKQQANSTAAVANIKTLLNALTAYSAQYTAVGYPAAVTALGGAAPCTPSAATSCLVDNSLVAPASGNVQGYLFVYTQGDANTGATGGTGFTLTGAPQAGVGQRYFFTDETDVVRYNDGAAATNASSPIGQ